jgi:uncharacterized BrkB/YihY/UPF0761 family membrane protein
MDETNLPENGVAPDAPPAPPAPVPDRRYFTPEPPVKPKTDGLFLALGLMAPIILMTVAGMLIPILGTIADTVGSGLDQFLYMIPMGLEPLLFVAVLVSFIVGKANGNVRLKSFGLGGLVAYAAGALLLLLVFGSCLVLGAGGGLLG